MEMVPLRSTSPAELHHSPTISSRSQLDDDGIEAHQNGRDQKTVDHTQSAEPHGPRHRSTALEPHPTATQSSSRSKRLERLSEGAHRKRVQRFPFLHPPIPGDEAWLREEHAETEWLDLFYDLVVVAVLTIFSTTHEIQRPDVIPVFLSYFAIIAWVWSSQIRYDVRYEANDGYHRIMKAFQLGTFAYIGAGSGNWNTEILYSGPAATAAEIAAAESFTTIGASYAVSRGLLAIEYLVCMLQGYRFKRSIDPLLYPFIAMSISCVMCVIAAAMPAHSKALSSAKIGLLYGSIGVELFMWRYQFAKHLHGFVSTAGLAERYGAFSLIILGEGFISIIRSLNNVIAGVDENAGASYGQVILALVIMFMLWTLLFGRFDRQDKVSQTRALFWESIHFPLHFSILLLLAGIVNTITSISTYSGVEKAADSMNLVVETFSNGTRLSQDVQEQISNYFSPLELIPSFDVEYAQLSSIASSSNSSDDLMILEYQYYGQVMVQVFTSYGVELSDHASATYDELYATNTSSRGEDVSDRQTKVHDLLLELIQETTDGVTSGVVWLFPCAGAVLILAAVRSMIWYRFEGYAHYIIHTLQIVAGICLGLLGLLDIGRLQADLDGPDLLQGTAPILRLMGHQAPLIIVAVTYWSVYYITQAALLVLDRLRGDVFEDENEEAENGEAERKDEQPSGSQETSRGKAAGSAD